MDNKDTMFKYGSAHLLDLSNTDPSVTHKTAFINEGTSLVSVLELFLMLHEDEKYKDVLDIRVAELLLNFAKINSN